MIELFNIQLLKKKVNFYQEIFMLVGYQDYVIRHSWAIYVKSKVYINNLQSILELKNEMIDVLCETEHRL